MDSTLSIPSSFSLRAKKGWHTRKIHARMRMKKNLRDQVLGMFMIIISLVTFFYLSLDGFLNALYEVKAQEPIIIHQISAPEDEVKDIRVIQWNFEGEMFDAIKSASHEFDVDPLLLVGIANAESTLGKNFIYSYDEECNNWFGIKPPTGRRDDGSYLRCFYTPEAGARTAAKLISKRYVAQGLDTPEKICPIWVG